jgi:hypothetical protein
LDILNEGLSIKRQVGIFLKEQSIMDFSIPDLQGFQELGCRLGGIAKRKRNSTESKREQKNLYHLQEHALKRISNIQTTLFHMTNA